MSIDKKELELLSSGYLAAAQNDQDKLRAIATKMAGKFDYWIPILQTGAKLSLVSIDLTSEKLQTESVKEMIGRIGWHGHKTTYSRLNTALVTLRGKSVEINRLKEVNTKGEVVAAMLTVAGQIIFKNHVHAPELFDDEARESAVNTLETFKYISEHEKVTKRALAADVIKTRRKNKSEGSGFWSGAGEMLGMVADIFNIFT